MISALIALRAMAETADTPTPEPESKRAKIIAAASIGAMHAAYATWSYFAWYRDVDTEDFHLERTTWFRPDAYSGSADKVGHFWSNYALTRGTTAACSSAACTPSSGPDRRARRLIDSGAA